MKKTYDKHGRTLYKYAHSVAQGGNVYSHKVMISNKDGLKNVLKAITLKFNLIDSTIKVYDNIFFFFFHIPKSLAPIKLIESIQKNTSPYAEWDENYLFTGVYDLQEKNIRNYLKQGDFEYDKG